MDVTLARPGSSHRDELRSAVERLALPVARQIEWLSRRGVRPEELVGQSSGAVRAALDDPSPGFSPVLRLRLEALADQLGSMSCEPDALLETPEAMLQHSSWALVRQLAGAALRERGWPAGR